MAVMPDQFYSMEQDDYFLLRRGYGERIRYEQEVLRFQTALIAEAFVGKGQGIKFVMSAWKIGEEKSLTREQIKAALDKKRKSEALRRYGRKS